MSADGVRAPPVRNRMPMEVDIRLLVPVALQRVVNGSSIITEPAKMEADKLLTADRRQADGFD